MKKPFLLAILDGFGLGQPVNANAIHLAEMPFLQRAMEENPFVSLDASGLAVGLPEGQMGNSEVGHTNIGAGRVVYQDLTRITKSIQEGEFSANPVLVEAMERCITQKTTLHLMGLLSPGGVHSHSQHLYALLQMAKQKGVEQVAIHCFLDGRDVPPVSAMAYLEELEQQCEKTGVGSIASIAGRYYAMDRDQRWERVEKAYQVLTQKSDAPLPTARQALQQAYDSGTTDEFVVPVACNGGYGIAHGDSVIFFNFRPDRAREITAALVEENFSGFPRPQGRKKVYFVTMTQVDSQFVNTHTAFPSGDLKNTLGEYLSRLGKTQLRIAETEKYAHVTFFFNGGVEQPYAGEERILVPSPQVATYDLQPEMSIGEVTDRVCHSICQGRFDLIVLNFANCDMVGHTGDMEAAILAVEAVDSALERVVEAITQAGGVALVTADHGNADQMVDEGGEPFTAHTCNPVPLLLFGKQGKLREGGRLADIAPTILDLMELPKPGEMEGNSLFLSL